MKDTAQPPTISELPPDPLPLAKIKRFASTSEWKEANMFIEKGWITVLIVKRYTDGEEYPQFIMGWMQDGDPVRPNFSKSIF